MIIPTMTLDTLIEYLAAKKGAEQDFPFGPDVLVFKVMGKLFALIALEESPLRVNLKCDPTRAEILRGIFPALKPGYHMNKKHWNTVILDGSIPRDEVWGMMDESYDLVVKGLKSGERERFQGLRSGRMFTS